jgi:hypothetical protein
MNPPAGRLQVGDRVTAPGGRAGRVVSERLTVSNGSWRYRVELDGGGTAEFSDFELKKAAA